MLCQMSATINESTTIATSHLELDNIFGRVHSCAVVLSTRAYVNLILTPGNRQCVGKITAWAELRRMATIQQPYCSTTTYVLHLNTILTSYGGTCRVRLQPSRVQCSAYSSRRSEGGPVTTVICTRSKGGSRRNL